jgi:hypothetical protein
LTAVKGRETGLRMTSTTAADVIPRRLRVE